MRPLFQTFDSIVRSIVSLAIIGINMNAQAASTIMPPILALCCGLIGFLWVIPTFWSCCVFGILGTPSSWKRLLRNASYDPDDPTAWSIIWTALLTTFWQAIVFRPFTCPEVLHNVCPEWLIPILFRETPTLFPPSTAAAAVRNEIWIFVNGIGTNRMMAQQSQRQLEQIFGRHCWLCYMPTNSIWFDLLWTLLSEKMGWSASQPLLRNTLHNAIVQAAAGRYERVVLVAHTHGTLTATLRELENIDPHFSHLLKRFLEVYTFGHGAHSAPQVGAYLEHLVNGRDTVAWMGVLFPYPQFWRNARGEAMQIMGRICKEPGQWGHLFQTHYLEPMIRNGAFRSSRLHLFRNGRVANRAFQLKSS